MYDKLDSAYVTFMSRSLFMEFHTKSPYFLLFMIRNVHLLSVQQHINIISRKALEIKTM